MSNQPTQDWIETEKDTFAEDHLELEYDSDEFIEKFKEHLQDLEHFNNHPSLSAYNRNPSLVG